MKFFGIKFGKEQRNSSLQPEIPTYNDALNFSSVFNSYSAMNISAVYRAVEIISDSVAILPINVKVRNEANVENHSLNMIFKDSLGGLTKYNFMKLLIQSVLLKGNGYAYINRAGDGTVTELRYLETADVQVYYNKLKNELYYTCKNITNKRIEPCNMIHLIKNTYDGFTGVSVLTYASRSIKLANSTENSANNFFNSGCNLSGVLTVQGQLSSQQRLDIKNSWNQAYSSGGNGLAILLGNMDYKPIQLSASDSQMIESRLFNVSDIARFFGLSPVMLGDLSHSSYSTIEATLNQFLLHTLQPYISMVEAEFSRKLLKPSESTLEVNLDEKYILRTDKAQTASYYSSLLDKGILSINEVRKELGYSDIEGGDKHIRPYTKLEDNIIESKNSKDDEEL